MIKLTLGNIAITSIGSSSGFFIGEKNTHKKFRSNKVINEIVGELSGKDNKTINNYWVVDKLKWEDE